MSESKQETLKAVEADKSENNVASKKSSKKTNEKTSKPGEDKDKVSDRSTSAPPKAPAAGVPVTNGKSGKTTTEDTDTQNSTINPDIARRMDDLLQLWQNFQNVSKPNYNRLERLQDTLNSLEKSVDKYGKFCGEYQLIWKVKEFSRCYNDARKGEKNMILFSPAFDSHRSGYKLQLSLCPNGDGKGKGIAMSLFFAILKGPYDSLLSWPFKCPVTFTLLEQASDPLVKQPRDVAMTFTPNPRPDNNAFLHRPTDTKNLSLGFQKFIPLNELFDGEYIKDDTLYIKVYVDISGVMAL